MHANTFPLPLYNIKKSVDVKVLYKFFGRGWKLKYLPDILAIHVAIFNSGRYGLGYYIPKNLQLAAYPSTVKQIQEANSLYNYMAPSNQTSQLVWAKNYGIKEYIISREHCTIKMPHTGQMKEIQYARI